MTYKPEIRGKSRWEKCSPEIMATGSQAAIRFALEDARHEILKLHERIDALNVVVRLVLLAGRFRVGSLDRDRTFREALDSAYLLATPHTEE